MSRECYIHFLQDQENVIACIIHPSYRICITVTFLLRVASINNSTEIVICMMPVKDHYNISVVISSGTQLHIRVIPKLLLDTPIT